MLDDLKKNALDYHRYPVAGKIEVAPTKPLSTQRDLALAELDLVTGMTIYQKVRVEIDRATAATLEHNGIQIQDAINGTVSGPVSATMP